MDDLVIAEQTESREAPETRTANRYLSSRIRQASLAFGIGQSRGRYEFEPGPAAPSITDRAPCKPQSPDPRHHTHTLFGHAAATRSACTPHGSINMLSHHPGTRPPDLTFPSNDDRAREEVNRCGLRLRVGVSLSPPQPVSQSLSTPRNLFVLYMPALFNAPAVHVSMGRLLRAELPWWLEWSLGSEIIWRWFEPMSRDDRATLMSKQIQSACHMPCETQP